MSEVGPGGCSSSGFTCSPCDCQTLEFLLRKWGSHYHPPSWEEASKGAFPWECRAQAGPWGC